MVEEIKFVGNMIRVIVITLLTVLLQPLYAQSGTGAAARPAAEGSASSDPSRPDRAQLRKSQELTWQGNQLYNNEQFVEAESAYRQALEGNPAMTEGRFNLGNSTYRQSRFEEAATRFGSLAEQADLPAELRSKAYYNQGNALFEASQFPQALEAYKQALRLKPGDENSKHNLALTRMMMQQEEQQDQDQDQDEQDQDQDQDQQDQDQDQQDQDQDEQDQDQDQEGEQEQENEQDQQNPDQPSEPKERNMSPEEIERILEALEQDEKEVQEKINAQRIKGIRTDSEKDW